YKFTGGVRLPINFSGMAYFMQFENNKRRVDWSILYLRQTQLRNDVVSYVFIDTVAGTVTELPNEQLSKTAMDLVQGTVSYPLNKFESIRLHLGLRRDAHDYKAQDILSLSFPEPDRRKYWVMSKAEYVFDNIINPVINIYRGFRFKFYGEYMYQFNGQTGGFYNLGTEFRYYHKIYKNFTWAARFAAAHSGGNKKVLYFVGGVDNWLWAKYADQTPIRAGENYAFQALTTNMRGYEQNSWNGNTYAVLNTEFRLPVLSTFIKRPIQSTILRNMQLVAFADIGSGWYGLWPTETNVSNDKIFPKPGTYAFINDPVIVSIDDTKGVFGLGYGAGLRTLMFGYFLRLDCAWNTDNHRKSPLLHFSIGTDF
ncbi:MAG: outer membrane protein assembly factor, partial [Taibaiella sp.]|nr:outer membrane protein assembly factor [Taibaiella sp.]